MQEIRLQVPFDHQDFIRTQKLVWKFMNKKFIKTNLTYTIVSIFLTLLFLLTPGELSHYPVYTTIVCGSLFYFLYSWVGFYERRVRFFSRVKNIAGNDAINAIGCIFIFSDYGIEYSDAEKLYKHSWPLFSRFVIIDDTILILLKESSAVLFTLSKKELGDSNYTAVCEVLTEKLG
jgi:hypothetical protein